jgi:hypothetical protein
LHHWNCFEVEACERLPNGQSSFGQVTLDAATTAIGDLVLGECGKEASGKGLCRWFRLDQSAIVSANAGLSARHAPIYRRSRSYSMKMTC